MSHCVAYSVQLPPHPVFGFIMHTPTTALHVLRLMVSTRLLASRQGPLAPGGMDSPDPTVCLSPPLPWRSAQQRNSPVSNIPELTNHLIRGYIQISPQHQEEMPLSNKRRVHGGLRSLSFERSRPHLDDCIDPQCLSRLAIGSIPWRGAVVGFSASAMTKSRKGFF